MRDSRSLDVWQITYSIDLKIKFVVRNDNYGMQLSWKVFGAMAW